MLKQNYVQNEEKNDFNPANKVLNIRDVIHWGGLKKRNFTVLVHTVFLKMHSFARKAVLCEKPSGGIKIKQDVRQ